jgi:hypothetical protein
MFTIQSYTGPRGKAFGDDQLVTIGEFATESELREFIIANQDTGDFERWSVAGEAEEVWPVDEGKSLILKPPASKYL